MRLMWSRHVTRSCQSRTWLCAPICCAPFPSACAPPQNVFPLLPITVSVPEGARRVVAVCLGEAEGAVRGGYFSRGKQVG